MYRRNSAAAIRHELGLDQPLPVQYIDFVQHAVRGDFGTSVRSRVPALRLVIERVPVTLQLAAVALGLRGHRGTATRDAFRNQTQLRLRCGGHGGNVSRPVDPQLWLDILLILVLGVNLRLLPISGTGGPWHLVMPGITLGSLFMASLARLTRSSLLDVLGQD